MADLTPIIYNMAQLIKTSLAGINLVNSNPGLGVVLIGGTK
jgi:hypothetical protein